MSGIALLASKLRSKDKSETPNLPLRDLNIDSFRNRLNTSQFDHSFTPKADFSILSTNQSFFQENSQVWRGNGRRNQPQSLQYLRNLAVLLRMVVRARIRSAFSRLCTVKRNPTLTSYRTPRVQVPSLNRVKLVVEHQPILDIGENDSFVIDHEAVARALTGIERIEQILN